MAFISIITINLNDVKGLRKTMNSVFAQTFTDYEYIVVDGASTDESYEEILKHKDKISRYISEKDDGIYDAMNKGIALASGDYCLFLNSGDYLYQHDVFQKIYEQASGEDIIYGDIMSAKDNVIINRSNSPAKVTSTFLLAGVIPHPAQFIKRSLFDEHGNYLTSFKLSSDYAFFVKLFFTTNLSLRHVPIPIAVFDLSGISSSPKHVDLFYSERKEIQDQYFPKAMAKGYHILTSVLRSKLFNNKVVGVPVRYVKRIVLRILGESKEPS
jgi:glycosyltransferase involved in cell wall biosynthesis